MFFVRKQGLISQLIALTVTSKVTEARCPGNYAYQLGVCRNAAQQPRSSCSSGVCRPCVLPCVLSGTPGITVMHFFQSFSKSCGLKRNCLGRPVSSEQFGPPRLQHGRIPKVGWRLLFVISTQEPFSSSDLLAGVH